MANMSSSVVLPLDVLHAGHCKDVFLCLLKNDRSSRCFYQPVSTSQAPRTDDREVLGQWDGLNQRPLGSRTDASLGFMHRRATV